VHKNRSVDKKSLSLSYVWVESCYDVDSAWEALNDYLELSKRVVNDLSEGKPIDEADKVFLRRLYPDSLSVIDAASNNLQKANDDLNNFIDMGKAILEANGHLSYVLGDKNEKD